MTLSTMRVRSSSAHCSISNCSMAVRRARGNPSTEHIRVCTCMSADTDVVMGLDMISGVDLVTLIHGYEQKWIEIGQWNMDKDIDPHV